jgi:hypothetical protein
VFQVGVARLLPQRGAPEHLVRNFARHTVKSSGAKQVGTGMQYSLLATRRLFEPLTLSAANFLGCDILYSITSSATASSAGGTSMPSSRAVCMLMRSSNLVG